MILKRLLINHYNAEIIYGEKFKLLMTVNKKKLSGIGVALVEELIFRGYIFNKLLKIMIELYNKD